MKKVTLLIVLLAIITSVISSCDDSYSSSKQKKSKINGVIAKVAKTIKIKCSDYVTAKVVKVGCDSAVMKVNYHIPRLVAGHFPIGGDLFTVYLTYPSIVEEFKVNERPDLRSLPPTFMPK